ncbi:hypothetical protein [Chitinimonas koreensis]|uniref:hypothetical protein n=1 Tax=Chitinimonas koreensis TaxID=356302 RepID=UPI0004040C26|nr:hypothetical protein [Chitinimonas koreensis]QNM95400.1 hypothetical protein H9L41_16210 [Chitinimonas koreensis]
MKRILFPMLAAALLAACSDGDDNNADALPVAPKVAVESLAAGSYTVSLGDAAAPTVGRYYAAADGSRLLLVGDADGRLQALYRQAAGHGWVAVPAAKADVSVTLLRADAVALPAPTVAAMAGRYVADVAGKPAVFTVAADGTIAAAAGSACKLGGKLSAGKLPGTLQLALTAADCPNLPASASGVLAADPDYAPARFRLVADDGNLLVDLWAYAE